MNIVNMMLKKGLEVSTTNEIIEVLNTSDKGDIAYNIAYEVLEERTKTQQGLK